MQLSHKALVLAPEYVHISLMNTDEIVLNCTEKEFTVPHPAQHKDKLPYYYIPRIMAGGG